MPEPASGAFSALAQRIYSAGTSEQIYQAIVDTAVDLVAGCDHSCIMLLSGGTVSTAAATDAVAAAVDEFERALGEGPCLDAILEEVPQLDPDLTTASPWPRLAERVVATTPVRGMIGFRLLVDGRKAGALNLFSDTPGVFTVESLTQASVLASFASVAVMAATARERSGNLLKALDSNREIGKAVGLLMAAHKVPEERAFDILDKTSQSLNMKLAEVAAKVVQGQQDQYQSPA
ncbi:MAG: GAF and ANTAR domain-containing protein [Dermatophilaceae bacterium]